MSCSIEGCTLPVMARGVCNPHYQRLRHRGDLPPLLPPRRRAVCTVDGCLRLVHGRGLCRKHYQSWRVNRDPDPGEPVCVVDGCERAVMAKGCCNAHYQRWVSRGEPDAAPLPAFPCAACTHPASGLLDAALLGGYSYASVQRRFGLSDKQVRRHARVHLGLPSRSQRFGSCAVCRHPDLEEIEDGMVRGVVSMPALDLCYGFPRGLAAHHRKRHMTEEYVAALASWEIQRLRAVGGRA